MSAHRILVLHPDGSRASMSGHHGTVHAERWIAGQLDHAPDAIVLALDPALGADAMRAALAGLDHVRVDWHTLPDGRREIVGVYAETASGSAHLSIARAVRILAAPPDVAGDRCKLHGKSRLDASVTRVGKLTLYGDHADHARILRKLNRTKESS